MAIILRQAVLPPDIEQVRQLFLEYQRSLGIDLCFQGFPQELATLPGNYVPPQGRLYLAWEVGDVVGCVGLRPLIAHVAEMKRLYVAPAHRGRHIGRALAQRVIGDAKFIGYHELVLDTLPGMTEAQALYATMGFTDTDPYSVNPVPGVRYLKLCLSPRHGNQNV